MSDWIHALKEQHDAERNRREYHMTSFGPAAQRIWEALVFQIRNDVAKLNKEFVPIMKGEIKINNRELIPGDYEIDLDKLAFPAIRLTVQLDTRAESIRIEETRKETPEANYVKTTDRLQLHLPESGPIKIKDRDGRVLEEIEQASEYILRRFVAHA